MVKFAHTNIITDDWKKLADFYIRVFDCKPVFPERNLQGVWLDKATNISNAHITGVHLVLPGYENNLPTLEIFQYDVNLPNLESLCNRKGFGHIAFKVDHMEEIISKFLENGGELLGELVTTEITNAGQISFCYCKDPDGNIIEIQNWK